MKMTPKRALCGAALTIGTLQPAIHEASQLMYRPDMSSLEVAAIATHDKVTAYWQQELGSHAAKIAVLRRDESTLCHQQDGLRWYLEGSNRTAAAYCSTVDKVVIGELAMKWLLLASSGSELSLREATAFIVAHEEGHGVQDTLRSPGEAVEFSVRTELQADCLSGEALATVDPVTVGKASLFYNSLPRHIPSHGTPSQAIASFRQGASGSGCELAAR